MIKNNIEDIYKDIPQNVKLICVSKFHPAESILEAYNTGEKAFGENRPQEMAEKAAILPDDIEWHFIGNLQSNKVKTVVPIASLIHSVSNDRLLQEIEKVSTKHNKTTNILLELHVAQEKTKHGFSPKEAIDIINNDFFNTYPHIKVCGLMGMASFISDERIIRDEFKIIHDTFQTLKDTIFKDKESFCEMSMGMSTDYKIAIEEGSTMVRIGSSIFGNRDYNK